MHHALEICAFVNYMLIVAAYQIQILRVVRVSGLLHTPVCLLLNKAYTWQELAADIANFGSQKEQRTKAAQAKLKAAKAGLEGSRKGAKDAAQRLTQAVAEAEAAASERHSLTEQLQAAQKALTGEALSGPGSVLSAPALSPIALHRLCRNSTGMSLWAPFFWVPAPPTPVCSSSNNTWVCSTKAVRHASHPDMTHPFQVRQW